jgi:hypothetical protein
VAGSRVHRVGSAATLRRIAATVLALTPVILTIKAFQHCWWISRITRLRVASSMRPGLRLAIMAEQLPARLWWWW